MILFGLIYKNNKSHERNLFLFLCVLLPFILLAQNCPLVLSHLSKLFADHIVYRFHKLLCLILVAFPVPQGHLIQTHHL